MGPRTTWTGVQESRTFGPTRRLGYRVSITTFRD